MRRVGVLDFIPLVHLVFVAVTLRNAAVCAFTVVQTKGGRPRYLQSSSLQSLPGRFSNKFRSTQPQPQHLLLQESRQAITELSSSNVGAGAEEDDSNTVTKVTSADGNTVITLIGTAHLSKKSNEQVKSMIESIKPNIVMVELDPTRLERIGIDSVKDIKNAQVISSGDAIVLPEIFTKDNPLSFKVPFFLQPIQNMIVEAVTLLSRKLLTGMYNDMSKEINTSDDGAANVGGGEFLAAIRAAEDCDNCSKIILGDRSSVTTIRRAFQLAIQSGDPFGVLSKLNSVNEKEMKALESKVRDDLIQQKKKESGGNLDIDEDDIDQAELSVAMMEALKQDTSFRNKLFQQLEQSVPEFTQAFLKERDYIMSESIRQEIIDPSSTSTPKHVVAVVGLAHVPGMQVYLQEILAKCN